jgi:hypothetical protein
MRVPLPNNVELQLVSGQHVAIVDNRMAAEKEEGLSISLMTRLMPD